MKRAVIHRDPDIQGGVPVFTGTRVPLNNLLDCLEAGDRLDQFLADYPAVSREQAVAALELAREAVVRYLEDREDAVLAEQARAAGGRAKSITEVRKLPGLDG